MSVQQRKIFLNGNITSDENLVPMDRVCLMQIWVEVLNGDPKHFKPQHKNEIVGVLRKMKDWEKAAMFYVADHTERKKDTREKYISKNKFRM